MLLTPACEITHTSSTRRPSSVLRNRQAQMDLYRVLFILAVLWNNATSAPRQKRLSLAANTPSYYFTNINGHPDTYSFGYDIEDPETGNTQFRSEEKYPNGTVVGSYGYVDPNGKMRSFSYMADKNGYRVLSEAHKQNYVDVSKVRENSSTEASVTWTRPRKNNKKKIEKITKKPSELLETPHQNYEYRYY